MAQFQDDDIQNTGVEHQMFKMARSPHPDLSCEPMVDKANWFVCFFYSSSTVLRLEYTYVRKHTHKHAKNSLSPSTTVNLRVNSKTNNQFAWSTTATQ